MTVNQAHDTTSGTGEGAWRWPVPHDPGDLSRRLASRREELRLTVSQVARRAGVEPRYLAYLENFPAQPGAATLRELAAALRTTPSALLGAGQEASLARDRGDACWGSTSLVERMQPAECYRMLASRGIGRIAFATASGLMIVPVSYVATDRTIVIRTGSTSMIAVHGNGPVSFEADYFDLQIGRGWSVLVRGEARRVLEPAELRHLREDCDLRPWPAGEHDLFVRIVPSHVTGHRIRSQ